VLVSIYRDAATRRNRAAHSPDRGLVRTKRTFPKPCNSNGGLYLQYGEAADAAAIYQRLIDIAPENLDAGKG